MSPSGVILIIGAGARVGKSVALKFASNGYKVAMAARSLVEGYSPEGYLNIKCDLADPSCVPSVFQDVEKTLGLPNIVVFNGANRLVTPPKDPLALSLENIGESRKVGLDSAYVAAQEALRCFKKYSPSTPTAFIYTGNALSQIAIPGVLPFALGKVAAAMIIEYAANAYGEDGYRFYFADQREPSGIPVGLEIDGDAHADMYWILAHESKQSKWLVTFTKDGGRRPFVGVDFEGNTRESYDQQFGR